MAILKFPLGPIGFGAFKIGRNQGIKYPHEYELPDEATVDRLLNGLLDLGVNYIDTAPAYGLSEERIGKCIAHRRHEFILSTKVGESIIHGQSKYDFSEHRIRNSVQASLSRLRTDELDIAFIHARRDDLRVLRKTDVVPVLIALRDAGLIRAIGLSAYTTEAIRETFPWADVVMLTYHPEDRTLEPVMQEAAQRGLTVIVKKGLASGHLPPKEAIQFVLRHLSVTSLVVGTLSLDHLRENLRWAREIRPSSTPASSPP